MKYILLFITIFLVDLVAQTAPSGYTTNYQYRKWSDGANPSADSLNANWDDLDADIKTAYDSANASTKVKTYGAQTIAGHKTFSSGATFSAASTGVVTFNDSVLSTTADHVIRRQYPDQTSFSFLGSAAKPYARVWSVQYNIMNAAGTDSATLVYEDGAITVSGASFTADTLKGFSTVSHRDLTYSVPDVTDSSLTVAYSNVVLFSLPGANMTNLENLTMSDIPTGAAHIVYFKVGLADPPYTVTFKDNDGATSTDGNLVLAGDFTLTVDDTIVLMYVDGEGLWYEISRSDN